MAAIKLGALGLLALVLGACGSSGSPGAAHNAQVIAAAQRAAGSEQSIRQAFLGLPGARLDDIGDVGYPVPGGGCTVNVILTSPSQLATYQGDPNVVLSPAGTIGVKVTGTSQDQAACLREASRVLASP